MQLNIRQLTNTEIVVVLFFTMSILELLNMLTGRWLNQFALYPRATDALSGILLSPFIHGNLWHYTSNIFPLCLFSFLCLQYGQTTFWKITSFIIIGTGVLVWLLGREALHLGASGLIYGYFGFLIFAGFISKRLKLIAISLLVSFFYGGMIFGVLPVAGFISWESHLFGFLIGVVAAKLWAKDIKR